MKHDSLKIKIVGEDHKKDSDYREQAEGLAEKGKIILIREGDDCGTDTNVIFGIEDPIVIQCANLMYAQHMGLNSSLKLEYIKVKKLTEEDELHKHLWNSFFKNDGRKEIAYYIHAIGQLYLKSETNKEIEEFFSSNKERFPQDANDFFKAVKKHSLFEGAFHDDDVTQKMPDDLIEYFFKTKLRWDSFLFEVINGLSKIILQVKEYNNPEFSLLKEENLTNFRQNFQSALKLDPDQADFTNQFAGYQKSIKDMAEKVMKDLRNAVWANNLLKLKKLFNNTNKEVYCIIGNQHIEGLKLYLMEQDFTFYDKDEKPNLNTASPPRVEPHTPFMPSPSSSSDAYSIHIQSLIQQAKKIVNPNSTVSIIFTDEKLVTHFQTKLTEEKIYNPGMMGELRKPNTRDIGNNSIEYEFILQLEEYNDVMGQGAFEALLESQTAPSFKSEKSEEDERKPDDTKNYAMMGPNR